MPLFNSSPVALDMNAVDRNSGIALESLIESTKMYPTNSLEFQKWKKFFTCLMMSSKSQEEM